jgi:hypothetical protein
MDTKLSTALSKKFRDTSRETLDRQTTIVQNTIAQKLKGAPKTTTPSNDNMVMPVSTGITTATDKLSKKFDKKITFIDKKFSEAVKVLDNQYQDKFKDYDKKFLQVKAAFKDLGIDLDKVTPGHRSYQESLKRFKPANDNKVSKVDQTVKRSSIFPDVIGGIKNIIKDVVKDSLEALGLGGGLAGIGRLLLGGAGALLGNPFALGAGALTGLYFYGDDLFANGDATRKRRNAPWSRFGPGFAQHNQQLQKQLQENAVKPSGVSKKESPSVKPAETKPEKNDYSDYVNQKVAGFAVDTMNDFVVIAKNKVSLKGHELVLDFDKISVKSGQTLNSTPAKSTEKAPSEGPQRRYINGSQQKQDPYANLKKGDATDQDEDLNKMEQAGTLPSYSGTHGGGFLNYGGNNNSGTGVSPPDQNSPATNQDQGVKQPVVGVNPTGDAGVAGSILTAGKKEQQSQSQASNLYNKDGTFAGDIKNRKQVAAVVVNEFRKAGMSDAGTAGILANITSESRFDPTLRHPDQPRFSGEAHFAHGLFQEGGDEWNGYAKWMAQNGYTNWQDPALQARYAAMRLSTAKEYRRTWDAMNSGSKEQAAVAYVRGYLRPAAQYQAQRSAEYSRGVPDNTYYTGNLEAVRPDKPVNNGPVVGSTEFWNKNRDNTKGVPTAQNPASDHFFYGGRAASQGVGKMDPRINQILKQAAAEFPLRVSLYSGQAGREGQPNHGPGYAADVAIFDANGRSIPNYQDPRTYRVYELFAQKTLEVQKKMYPELNGQWSWGGQFGNASNPRALRYGDMDEMHFQINNPERFRGSIAGGLDKQFRSVYDQNSVIPNAGPAGLPAPVGDALTNQLANLKDFKLPDDFKGKSPLPNIGPQTQDKNEMGVASSKDILNSEQNPFMKAKFEEKKDDNFSTAGLRSFMDVEKNRQKREQIDRDVSIAMDHPDNSGQSQDNNIEIRRSDAIKVQADELKPRDMPQPTSQDQKQAAPPKAEDSKPAPSPMDHMERPIHDPEKEGPSPGSDGYGRGNQGNNDSIN